MTITLLDGRTALRQWDTGRRLIVAGLPEGAQVHLAREGDSDALQAPLTPTEGGVSALIPDELLQSEGKLKVWLYAPDETGYSTHLCVKSFLILARPKPADYVYTPTETALWTKLETRLAALEAGGGDGGGEVWETIIDYTVPEDCAQVLLTTDINGNAFKLKRAIVTFVLLPITGVTSSAVLRYTVDGTVSSVYSAAHYAYGVTEGPSAAGQCRVQRFEVLDTPSGVWLSALTNSNADSNCPTDGYIGSRMIQSSVHEPLHFQTLSSKVTEISAAGVGSYTTAVGAGTRIKMLGVRA